MSRFRTKAMLAALACGLFALGSAILCHNDRIPHSLNAEETRVVDVPATLGQVSIGFTLAFILLGLGFTAAFTGKWYNLSVGTIVRRENDVLFWFNTIMVIAVGLLTLLMAAHTAWEYLFA